MTTIKGTNKADALRGTDSNDAINGRGGNDLIMGRGGADILKGGPGRDTFVVSVDQFDFIKDFQPGKDKVVLVASIFDAPQSVNPYEPGSPASIAHGVVQYNGAPVVYVGDAPLSHGDLLLT